ncbi:hypothetical protein [Mesorhizobium sp. WSM1497]|uniref:hypothetical protein n=1 Tax=Mesorhizobium sp. WSM1497 TaxID=278153 RepID=UPI000A82C38E|nr:hypothetical protein [Mesorhizobium sp. WSM1497]
MTIEERKYPTELASPQQLHELAEEYRKAAHLLLQQGRPGKPLTRAPFRLSAIHAIELYLTALLLHCGHNPNQIRKMQHDLSARTEHALEAGLRLRTKTATHLHARERAAEWGECRRAQLGLASSGADRTSSENDGRGRSCERAVPLCAGGIPPARADIYDWTSRR